MSHFSSVSNDSIEVKNPEENKLEEDKQFGQSSAVDSKTFNAD